MKETTPFFKWIHEAAFKGLLHKGGIYLRNINKIETEFFVFNNEEGKPLCILEVGRDFNVVSEQRNFLLEKMPPWCLKLPGYTVLYRKVYGKGERPIENFRVRKFTPIERFVGDFDPRQFAGFLAATINFYRKQKKKEAA